MIVDLDDDFDNRFSFLKIDGDSSSQTSQKPKVLIKESTLEIDDKSNNDMTFGKAQILLKNGSFKMLDEERDELLSSALNFLSKALDTQNQADILDSLLEEVILKEKTQWSLFCIGFIYERNKLCVLGYLQSKLLQFIEKDDKKMLLATILCITNAIQRERDDNFQQQSKKTLKPKIVVLGDDESISEVPKETLEIESYIKIGESLFLLIQSLSDTSTSLFYICLSDSLLSIIGTLGFKLAPHWSLDAFIWLLNIYKSWTHSQPKLTLISIDFILNTLNKYKSMILENERAKKLLSTLCLYMNQYAMSNVEMKNNLAKRLMNLVPTIVNDIDECKNAKIIDPEVQNMDISLLTGTLLCLIGRLSKRRSTNVIREYQIEKLISSLISEFQLSIPLEQLKSIL